MANSKKRKPSKPSPGRAESETAQRRPAHRDAVFQSEFREDLQHWVTTGHRVAKRVLELVEAIMRDPFNGIGKPEPLKFLGPDIWSRRVTQEHRIVYLYRGDERRLSSVQIPLLRLRRRGGGRAGGASAAPARPPGGVALRDDSFAVLEQV